VLTLPTRLFGKAAAGGAGWEGRYHRQVSRESYRRERVIRASALAAFAVVVLAGCGGSTPDAGPVTTTSTVPPPHTQAQVYGWVSTTLDNGISLVRSVPAPATDAALLPAAMQLSTACSVSQQELTQTTWTGASGGDERSLSATLSQVQALVAAHPTGYGAQLPTATQMITQQLGTLARDVPSS